MPIARTVVAIDSVRESRLTGMYRVANGDSVRIAFENGALVAQQPGKFRAQLLHERDGGYFSPQLGGVARFREANGTRELVIVDGTGKELVRATLSARR